MTLLSGSLTQFSVFIFVLGRGISNCGNRNFFNSGSTWGPVGGGGTVPTRGGGGGGPVPGNCGGGGGMFGGGGGGGSGVPPMYIIQHLSDF